MMPVGELRRTLPLHSGGGRMQGFKSGRLRVRERSTSWLSLFGLMLAMGCATATVTPTVRAPAGLPRPDRVLVHDFEVAPAAGALNYQIAPSPTKTEMALTADEMRVGKVAGKILADSLIAELKGRGIDALRAGEAAPPEMNTLSIRGRFLWSEKDVRTMRARIWFYQGSGVNFRLVAQADADIPSDSKRGAAAVGSAAYTAAQEADARRMAKELAERVAGYYREQGWIGS